MSGMEVEELRPWRRRSAASSWARSSSRAAPAGRPPARVHGGRRRARARRPAADRLRRAQRARRHPVPLALVGAELPPGDDGKPFKIGVGKLRGVESFGMLCSARELKLCPTTTAACSNWPPMRRGRRHARAPAALDDTSSRSSSRPTWPCAERLRHRARGGGAHRRAAEDARPSRRCAPRTTSACRCGAGARPVRPLLGPHRARREHAGADAGLDGRAPGALRPAQRDARWSTSRTT
jgi:hypothetical protein